MKITIQESNRVANCRAGLANTIHELVLQELVIEL